MFVKAVFFVTLVFCSGLGRGDLQSLSSQGIAGRMTIQHITICFHRHPSSPCPDVGVLPSKPGLIVDESVVLSCLQAFPKINSSGASKLRAQHLLDVATCWVYCSCCS